jgi:hypothetical protein
MRVTSYEDTSSMQVINAPGLGVCLFNILFCQKYTLSWVMLILFLDLELLYIGPIPSYEIMELEHGQGFVCGVRCLLILYNCPF